MLYFFLFLLFSVPELFLLHSVSIFFIMLTVVKPITHSENGSTRVQAIGKRRVRPGNIDHISNTFP